MNLANSITHVIFDMDGLLLNTEPLYTAAAEAITARFGKEFTWAVKSLMIGKKAADSTAIIIRELDLPLTVEEYLALRKPLVEKLFPAAQPMPGALRLTRHLHNQGVPQAVATSSDPHHFGLKTSRHREWFSIFDQIVFAEDPLVKHGKPAPDVFLLTAQRLTAQPGNCLVLEDAPAGVEAALAAGMKAVAVADPNLDRSAFPGAHEVLRSLDDFVPERWGLPAYD